MDGTSIVLDLDKKIANDKMDPVFDLVKKYNVRTEFSCGDLARIECVLSHIPNALINYDGKSMPPKIKGDKLVGDQVRSLFKPALRDGAITPHTRTKSDYYGQIDQDGYLKKAFFFVQYKKGRKRRRK